MKSKRSFEVPVQKGPIDPNPMTSKQMTYPEKVTERKEQVSKLRWGQTQELKIPRQGRR